MTITNGNITVIVPDTTSIFEARGIIQTVIAANLDNVTIDATSVSLNSAINKIVYGG